jgi:uncharacterized protein (DUF1330 family)
MSEASPNIALQRTQPGAALYSEFTASPRRAGPLSFVVRRQYALITLFGTNQEDAMKSWWQVLVVGAIGAAIGVAGIRQVVAEVAKPPAYMVVEYEIADREAFQTYIEGVNALPTSRVFLARHAKGTTLSGEAPKWIGIVKYPSLEEALAFENSPQYQALVASRDKGAKWRAYVVEGLPH